MIQNVLYYRYSKRREVIQKGKDAYNRQKMKRSDEE